MIPLHPDTSALVEKLRAHTPHSLLITGKPGVGLLFIAEQIATKKAIAVMVTPNEDRTVRNIPIESIRRLYQETRSKSTTKQFVIIHEADTMTRAAQTALLKLLEEPAKTIYFILTSHRPDSLLPTILSRLQQYPVKPLTVAQSEQYITELGVSSPTKYQQLLFLASGVPEELRRLATDEQYFADAVERIQDARSLLQSSTYSKLLVVNSYKDNRQRSLQLLQTMINLVRHSLSQNPQTGQISQLTKLLETEEALQANCNVRLQLTQYVI